MKHFSSIFLIIILVWACSSNQKLAIQQADKDTEMDSVSYELIVLDPGFDSWYLIHSSPAKYHDQSYYEYWNQRYVNAWNYDKIWKHHSGLLDGMINYESNTDYGLEINHKLFYYFIYVENELHIPLIPDGPKSY